jgi:hypothetical protein
LEYNSFTAFFCWKALSGGTDAAGFREQNGGERSRERDGEREILEKRDKRENRKKEASSQHAQPLHLQTRTRMRTSTITARMSIN